MTFLLYTAWVAVLMLMAGELDRLIREPLTRRFKVQYPDLSWWVPFFSSLCIPGLGQFLNGQPLKALFLFAWPLLTMFRSPIPPPWQLWMVKTLWLFFPVWFLGAADALIVGAVQEYRRRQQDKAVQSDRDDAMRAWLEKQ